MSEPTQTCALCGRSVVVVQNGRGFPPDTAKRKLRKQCGAAGCPCEPKYRAGISSALRLDIAARLPTPARSGEDHTRHNESERL